VTFEASEDETVVLIAGRNEYDSHPIWTGSVDGRFAIVPADALEADRADADGLRLEDMRIKGQSITVPANGSRTVTLSVDGRDEINMSSAGVYGLLWVPIG